MPMLSPRSDQTYHVMYDNPKDDPNIERAFLDVHGDLTRQEEQNRIQEEQDRKREARYYASKYGHPTRLTLSSLAKEVVHNIVEMGLFVPDALVAMPVENTLGSETFKRSHAWRNDFDSGPKQGEPLLPENYLLSEYQFRYSPTGINYEIHHPWYTVKSRFNELLSGILDYVEPIPTFSSELNSKLDRALLNKLPADSPAEDRDERGDIISQIITDVKSVRQPPNKQFLEIKRRQELAEQGLEDAKSKGESAADLIWLLSPRILRRHIKTPFPGSVKGLPAVVPEKSVPVVNPGQPRVPLAPATPALLPAPSTGAVKGGRAAEKSQDYAAHSESTAPTDEQLEEAVEFLETVMEIGAPQNEWEQQAVQRIHDVLVETLKSTRANGTTKEQMPEEQMPEEHADINGGVIREQFQSDQLQAGWQEVIGQLNGDMSLIPVGAQAPAQGIRRDKSGHYVDAKDRVITQREAMRQGASAPDGNQYIGGASVGPGQTTPMINSLPGGVSVNQAAVDTMQHSGTPRV